MAIQIGLYGIDSFTPIPIKIWPLCPYIGPDDPHGGIFALGNMCFHKPGSDRDLWEPLKFWHQGGARGPLLPTRLVAERRGVSRRVWHVELQIQISKQGSEIEITHNALRTRDNGTEAPCYNRGVTVSAVAIAIVTSSVTSNVKYITPMTSNIKHVPMYKTALSQSEARISTMHCINMHIICIHIWCECDTTGGENISQTNTFYDYTHVVFVCASIMREV